MVIIENDVHHKQELKKHINAIHSSSDISLVQRKLFNALIYNAYHDLSVQLVHKITIKKLCELIGFNSKDINVVKKSLLNLIGTIIEWNVLESNNPEIVKWRASSLISAADIEKGICTYEFSSLLREYLFNPKIYGKIDLNIMAQFKSSYGLALYENCIRYQGLPSTGWMSLDVFRKLMGVDIGKYKLFCDFKRRVLDTAINEVNKYSNIHIIPEIVKSGRKVLKLRFRITSNSTMIHVEHSINNKAEDILSNEFFIEKRKIRELLEIYPDEYILEKIHLVKSSKSYQSNRIKDKAGYIIKALKENFQHGKSGKRQNTQKIQAIDCVVQNRDDLYEKRKIEYVDYMRNRLELYVNTLSVDVQSKLLLDFENSLDQYSRKKFKQSGLGNKSIYAIFKSMMEKQMIEDDYPFMTCDEYIRNIE
ncbi:MAG: replication initiation protein [Gammaproteobacteria bacterium]